MRGAFVRGEVGEVKSNVSWDARLSQWGGSSSIHSTRSFGHSFTNQTNHPFVYLHFFIPLSVYRHKHPHGFIYSSDHASAHPSTYPIQSSTDSFIHSFVHTSTNSPTLSFTDRPINPSIIPSNLSSMSPAIHQTIHLTISSVYAFFSLWPENAHIENCPGQLK